MACDVFVGDTAQQKGDEKWQRGAIGGRTFPVVRGELISATAVPGLDDEAAEDPEDDKFHLVQLKIWYLLQLACVDCYLLQQQLLVRR